MRIGLIALVGASCFAHPVLAQQVPAPVAQVPTPGGMIVGGAETSSTLRAGTQVQLRLIEGLSTEGKKLKVGHRFNLEVAEPVSVNGQVVIPVGSRAVGEVTDVRNKGMWGKSGRIGARLVYVEANGRRLRLSGQMDDKGVTGTAGVVGAVAFVPVAGFFLTGTSARIEPGASVTGFLDEDIPVTFAPGAGAVPMVVAPTAADTVPAAPAP